ncbi:MAG: hypothetical protein QGM50_07255 [Anaerolineae bacterium]|nr:hypothetical protein [Anaerolineae bacterium]MDK1081328.1 hypothetical protein [Anaerolineae bacterium]MDK1118575.1 hypothetical protein [Anaerolineae bacterium]
MKRTLLTFYLLIILLSACGPTPESTMGAAEIQSTAVAAAWTIVAETKAAIPTATQIPPSAVPTNTSTATALPSPTQSTGFLPTATSLSDKDPCDRLLQSDPDGPDFPLKIINETKSPVTISIYLEKTSFGMCGYRSYQLKSKGSTLVRFPQGVMYGYAWINGKNPTTAQGGPWRPNNPDKWSVLIRETTLKMVGP